MNSSTVKRDIFLGILFSLLAAIGFSAKAIFVKLAFQDNVDAITLLALRMAFSLPFFIAVAIWAKRHHAEPLTKHDMLLIVGLGLMGYYLSSYLDFLGLRFISAGLERVILFLYPTMTVILSAVFFKHVISKMMFVAMLISYAGIALVFMHDIGTNGEATIVGASLVFASTLSYSIYLVGAGHAITRIGTLRFTAYAMLVASFASILQFIVMRPMSALNLPIRVYELSVAMAVLSTVLPIFLLSFSIRRIGSGQASLIGSIGPVSTILLAYIFLNESVSLMQILGSSLVLVGVFIISLNSERK